MSDFEMAFCFVLLALSAANCLLPLMMVDAIWHRERMAKEIMASWREAERQWELAKPAYLANCLPKPATPQRSPSEPTEGQ